MLSKMPKKGMQMSLPVVPIRLPAIPRRWYTFLDTVTCSLPSGVHAARVDPFKQTQDKEVSSIAGLMNAGSVTMAKLACVE